MAITRFETNIPQEIALKYATGKEVDGQFGPQLMFSLADGNAMYVPPIVGDLIADAGIGAGELFRLTKREIRVAGQKKPTTKWLIERLSDADDEDAAEPEPAPASQRQPAPTSGTGAAAAAKLPATPAVMPRQTQQTSYSNIMTRALCAAVDAASEASKYAEGKGFSMELNAEDVRAMAISMFIEFNRTQARIEAKGADTWAA